jgi:hypothetical protein
MTVVAFLVLACIVGAIGIAAGIIVAPVLTRATDRLSNSEPQEAAPGDDERD